jgi:hypothetical protein
VRVLKFPQWCDGGFRFSGVRHCVNMQSVPNVSKGCSALFFKDPEFRILGNPDPSLETSGTNYPVNSVTFRTKDVQVEIRWIKSASETIGKCM